MKTLSSTEFRANLSKMMDQVNDDHEPVIVTRSKGKPVIVVSLEDYAAMDETTYLLSSPKNASRLRRALERSKKGQLIEKDLIDP